MAQRKLTQKEWDQANDLSDELMTVMISKGTSSSVGVVAVAFLEHFPKRMTRAGFPCGHESDSRIVLEGRPVWDGEAVFRGSA